MLSLEPKGPSPETQTILHFYFGSVAEDKNAESTKIFRFSINSKDFDQSEKAPSPTSFFPRNFYKRRN